MNDDERRELLTRLEYLEGLLERTTAGPWEEYETVQADNYIIGPQGFMFGDNIAGPTYNRDNMRFLAATKQEVPFLIDTIRSLLGIEAPKLVPDAPIPDREPGKHSTCGCDKFAGPHCHQCISEGW